MPVQLLIPIATVFISVAVAVGTAVWFAFERQSTTRRRLGELATTGHTDLMMETPAALTYTTPSAWKRVAAFVPKSPKEMSNLERRMVAAGYRGTGPAVIYALSEMLLPIILGGFVLSTFGTAPRVFVAAIFLAGLGFFTPSLWLGRATARRQKELRNGLPDALDLLIVCLEAGSGLDQALLKVTDELALSYPALAEELRLVVTESRAGKPRIEAFKNLASRTKVDDIKSFVNMLVQTDRFGTSVSQALRIHADTLRTKRRQRAEERAAKLGVKLVFPLVFCLFPAFYVVVLGPSIIRFVRILFGQVLNK